MQTSGVEYRNEEDQCLPSKCLHSVGKRGTVVDTKKRRDKYKENTKGKVLVMRRAGERFKNKVSFEDGWIDKQRWRVGVFGRAVPIRQVLEPP